MVKHIDIMEFYRREKHNLQKLIRRQEQRLGDLYKFTLDVDINAKTPAEAKKALDTIHNLRKGGPANVLAHGHFNYIEDPTTKRLDPRELAGEDMATLLKNRTIAQRRLNKQNKEMEEFAKARGWKAPIKQEIGVTEVRRPESLKKAARQVGNIGIRTARDNDIFIDNAIKVAESYPPVIADILKQRIRAMGPEMLNLSMKTYYQAHYKGNDNIGWYEIWNSDYQASDYRAVSYRRAYFDILGLDEVTMRRLLDKASEAVDNGEDPDNLLSIPEIKDLHDKAINDTLF